MVEVVVRDNLQLAASLPYWLSIPLARQVSLQDALLWNAEAHDILGVIIVRGRRSVSVVSSVRTLNEEKSSTVLKAFTYVVHQRKSVLIWFQNQGVVVQFNASVYGCCIRPPRDEELRKRVFCNVSNAVTSSEQESSNLLHRYTCPSNR